MDSAAGQPMGGGGAAGGRVLVTGGAGYVGRFVRRALAQAGLVAIGYDDPSRAVAGADAAGEMLVGPLEGEALAALLRRTRPDAVVHLAGSRGGHRFNDPAGAGNHLGRNVEGTRSLLAAMAVAGPGRLVFAGSSAIYGNPARLPAAEDALPAPTSDYGRAKLAAERLILDWAIGPERHALVLRLANVAGADAESGLGWLPGDGTILPMAIRAAAGTIPVLPVTASGPARATAIRDYVHVGDVARAMRLAVQRLIAHPATAVLNIGSGQARSVAEVIAMTERVAGRRLRIAWHESPASEPTAFVADTARAAGLLGFRAEASALAAIVESAWRWYGRHGRAGEAAAAAGRSIAGQPGA